MLNNRAQVFLLSAWKQFINIKWIIQTKTAVTDSTNLNVESCYQFYCDSFQYPAQKSFVQAFEITSRFNQISFSFGTLCCFFFCSIITSLKLILINWHYLPWTIKFPTIATRSMKSMNERVQCVEYLWLRGIEMKRASDDESTKTRRHREK